MNINSINREFNSTPDGIAIGAEVENEYDSGSANSIVQKKMKNYGYLRVAAAAPSVKVADVNYNRLQIEDMAIKAARRGASLIVFPELSLTAYTCADLFRQNLLLEAAEKGLLDLAEFSESIGLKAGSALTPLIVAGAPLRVRGKLLNCAVFIKQGRLLGAVPKMYLPNNNEFYEKRWFASGADIDPEGVIVGITDGERRQDMRISQRQLFRLDDMLIGAELCEDLWVPVPPSCEATLAGADIIVNLSATNELIGKHTYLRQLVSQQSARCRCGYVYASAGAGESSTDLVYAGNTIIAEDGSILTESERFTERPLLALADIDVEKLRGDRRNSTSFADCAADYSSDFDTVECGLSYAPAIGAGNLERYVDPEPFVPSDSNKLDDRCREVLRIQAAGLVQRLRATGCKSLTVGLSGGLDSTLAILVAVDAFDLLSLPRTGIHAITMPGFGTTDRTYRNALQLIESLGVSGHEISIAASVTQHFSDIGHDISVHDVTYENGQARERTQILMDFANKTGGMVLGTGDLSELALGWCTYNGDHMSMYGVNASVPKTLVKHLVALVAAECTSEQLKSCLTDIVDTPISPELIPAAADGTIQQKTEDLVGPYELHDFFLYALLRHGFTPDKIYMLARKAFRGKYSKATILHWLKEFTRRFFNQQFKRSCMPDGPKTGSVCLSPRGDWRMPSDASSRLWLDSISKL